MASQRCCWSILCKCSMDIIELEVMDSIYCLDIRNQSHLRRICAWCNPPPVPKETVLLIFDKQLYLDGNLNCEDVGATTCFNGSCADWAFLLHDWNIPPGHWQLSYAIKLPNVPNFIFERGVGSPKTAENDPSSMEHPFLQSSWMLWGFSIPQESLEWRTKMRWAKESNRFLGDGYFCVTVTPSKVLGAKGNLMFCKLELSYFHQGSNLRSSISMAFPFRTFTMSVVDFGWESILFR